MRRRKTAAACALLLWAGLSAPLRAGKLDLDLYAAPAVPRRAPADAGLSLNRTWTPGDPRDLRGESRGVQYLSHFGYAGLGVAGLIGSVATGGVAPAIGFGLVALIHLYGAWELRKTRRPS
jgi:hypothetical protein